MLNLIEPFDLPAPSSGPDHVHLLVQAKQIAYHDRDRWLGDPRFADVPMERLISKTYADERRALIDPNARRCHGTRCPRYGSLTGDTVYVAAVDARRQRRVADLQPLRRVRLVRDLRPRPASCCRTAAPTSRSTRSIPTGSSRARSPLHTLIASLAFRDEKLWAALGCMGADGQPQIHLQAYVAMIDYGRDIQQALAGAALAVGALRARRGARHAAHRGALSAPDDRRARAARPPGRSLGRLERARGPRPRHHARSADRHAGRRLRSAQRRRGGRLLDMLEFIAEQRIAEAIAKGELDDLPGAGRPLQLDDDALDSGRNCASPIAS